MLGLLLSLFSGILFAIGLVVSGMTNPQKVIGFLDVFGNWDYTLVFVMGGAVGFNLITFHLLKKRRPLCDTSFHLPTKSNIDFRLIFGSALFGIGWGIAGICPGPGIVNLVKLNPLALLFVGSMMIGMAAYKLLEFLRRV